MSVVVFALGQGGSFSLAVSLIALRSSGPAHSAALSGMAQSMGYAIAAAGPLAAGLLHAVTAGWTVPLLCLLALCPLMAAAGAVAGCGERVPGMAGHTEPWPSHGSSSPPA